MYIDKFLIGYDDSLTGELNIDPMGLLVIWSSWGQDIFQSRITSIANDVRQYTLNLLHHAVMRNLLADESLQTAGAMKKRYSSKHDRDFLFASLIHLENIYIWSMLRSERQGVALTGVLGILKARRQMGTGKKEPVLRFGHESTSCLLTNQIALGTNGRYKSPMMNMRFFDSHYRYDLPDSEIPWRTAETFIRQVPALNKLFQAAKAYLAELMKTTRPSDLTPCFDSRFDVLKKAYIKAFGNLETVGHNSNAFWLKMTGFDRNAAGALYRVLKKEYRDKSPQYLPPGQVFTMALTEASADPDLEDTERMKLRHIIEAEPFLSLTELMFRGLQRQSQQTLTEFRHFWEARGLSDSHLPELAAKLLDNRLLQQSLTGTPAGRFRQLLELALKPTLEEQVKGLLTYHNGIMASRGQFPWITLAGENLSLQVSPYTMPEDRQNGDWVNHYYLPQFRHMLHGLWGKPV